MGALKTTFRDHLEAAISLEKSKTSPSIPSVNPASAPLNRHNITTLPCWISINPPRVALKNRAFYKIKPQEKKLPLEQSIILKLLSAESNVILLSWQKQGVIELQNGAVFESQIKKAFRKLALKHHPDRAPHTIDSSDSFIAAKKDFETLKKDLKKLKSKSN